MATFKQIVLSRYYYFKNRNKDWFKKRKSICDNCPFNSRNKKTKTLKERLMMLLNLSKSVCTICGCGLKYKQALPESVCGKEEIGLTPEWDSEY
jgi:ribosomal protein L37E